MLSFVAATVSGCANQQIQQRLVHSSTLKTGGTCQARLAVKEENMKLRRLPICIFLLVASLPIPVRSEEDFSTMPKAQLDQIDIYQVMRQAMPGPSKTGQKFSSDPFVTARIKTSMAHLLYPVDMAEFKTPDRDPKFRAQIMELQARMGEQKTGVLLAGQFEKLDRAAATLNERRIFPPIGLVIVGGKADGNSKYISAKGTWSMEDDAFPVNFADIQCLQSSQICRQTSADVVMPNQIGKDEDFNFFLSNSEYRVSAWDANEVSAYLDSDCRRTTLTINTSTKRAFLVITDRTKDGCKLPDGRSFPPLIKPRIATLVDPFKETQKFFDSRQKEAQKLQYQPAQEYLKQGIQ
ncbi:MAG: hypothetical protein ABI728_06795 [Betaproteobacteria bacterium]